MDEADHGQVELTETNELTPQRIGEYVALMVEAAPSLLGEETLAELRKFVETIRADGGYVPVPEVLATVSAAANVFRLLRELLIHH